MISVEEAYDVVLKHSPLAEMERVGIDHALGRILAEEIFADRHFPPFDRVTMDGIAISYESYKNGQTTFLIENIAAAGSPLKKLTSKTNCIEVMTGAMLPQNTDTVIRYEDITIEDKIATVNIDLLKYRQNVHFQGSDRKKDSKLLSKGKRINAPEMAVLATCGKSTVQVYKVPKIAIVSSGDELVKVSETPLAHQIRRSNNYSIAGALADFKVEVKAFHMKDDADLIKQELTEIINSYDVVVLSGGVSMGKYDFIPGALEALGVKKLFHKVKQRPGKPFWFGISEEGKTIFALPGNPVSSFMCTHKYVLAWIRKHLGLSTSKYFAELASDIFFRPDLNYFAQVELTYEKNGKTYAHPVEGNGSGDFVNLTQANAFIELPRGKEQFKAGEVYEILLINPF